MENKLDREENIRIEVANIVSRLLSAKMSTTMINNQTIERYLKLFEKYINEEVQVIQGVVPSKSICYIAK